MNRSAPPQLLALAALALLASWADPAAIRAGEHNPRRPNIVVIVSDDQGYAEAGCYGNKDIPTPHIDSLARHGVRFTNGYVSCPVCSPTRAGLMTGRYQQRFGYEFNPGPAQAAAADFGLPLSEVTLADRLKTAGYVTGLVGKWHLGYEPKYHPLRRGFDEFFGFLGGAHAYFDKARNRDLANPILRDTEPVDEQEYLTDAFTREAVAFIERHREQPFLLYLTYNAVHSPLQATAKYEKRLKNLRDPKRRTFAAMLTALDDGVGAVLAKLSQAGLDKDTLVFFLSDNGGPTRQTTSRNAPLRGYKGQVYEGGIRVPFLVQWKDRVPAGKTYDQPVISLDILATAVSVAGAKTSAKDKLDGVNLLPHLTGENAAPPHAALFWRFGRQAAGRKGPWKLVQAGGEPAELYNLTADIGEAKNLAGEKPEVVQELEAALKHWDAQLEEPRWKQPSAKAKAKTKAAKPGRKKAANG